jgi:hypothetical protein
MRAEVILFGLALLVGWKIGTRLAHVTQDTPGELDTGGQRA